MSAEFGGMDYGDQEQDGFFIVVNIHHRPCVASGVSEQGPERGRDREW